MFAVKPKHRGREELERQNLERVNNKLESSNTKTNQYATLSHKNMELEVAAIIASKKGSPQRGADSQ